MGWFRRYCWSKNQTTDSAKAVAQKCSIKKGIFKKHLTNSEDQQFYEKIPAQVFSCELSTIFKNIYFTKHLRTTASVRGSRLSVVKEFQFEICVPYRIINLVSSQNFPKN